MKTSKRLPLNEVRTVGRWQGHFHFREQSAQSKKSSTTLGAIKLGLKAPAMVAYGLRLLLMLLLPSPCPRARQHAETYQHISLLACHYLSVIYGFLFAE